MERSLALACLLLGLFILGHYFLDQTFQTLKTIPVGAEPALQPFATSLVSTSAVVLGLLSALSSRGFSTTAKVGVVSLTLDVLVGIALVGLLLAGFRSADRGAAALVAILFNVVWWGLAFGLLCIAMALIAV